MDSMLSQDFRLSKIPQVADNKKNTIRNNKKSCRKQVASRMRNHPPSARATEKISHSQLKKSTALAKHKEPSEKSHRRGKIHHRGKKEKLPSRIKKIHREEKIRRICKNSRGGRSSPPSRRILRPKGSRCCRRPSASVAEKLLFQGIPTPLMEVRWWRGASPLPRKIHPVDGAVEF